MKKYLIFICALLLFLPGATMAQPRLAVEPEVIPITNGVIRLELHRDTEYVRFDLFGGEILVYSFIDESGEIPFANCYYDTDFDYMQCDTVFRGKYGGASVLLALDKPTCTSRSRVDIYIGRVRHYIAVDDTPVDYECVFLPSVRN